VFEWVREANRSTMPAGSADLEEMLGILGLDNLLTEERQSAPTEVRELAAARERARRAGDYAEADRLREAIRSESWEVRDMPTGPELFPLTSAR
jgi:cysteinyl-tRNA synthetase